MTRSLLLLPFEELAVGLSSCTLVKEAARGGAELWSQQQHVS